MIDAFQMTFSYCSAHTHPCTHHLCIIFNKSERIWSTDPFIMHIQISRIASAIWDWQNWVSVLPSLCRQFCNLDSLLLSNQLLMTIYIYILVWVFHQLIATHLTLSLDYFGNISCNIRLSTAMSVIISSTPSKFIISEITLDWVIIIINICYLLSRCALSGQIKILFLPSVSLTFPHRHGIAMMAPNG